MNNSFNLKLILFSLLLLTLVGCQPREEGIDPDPQAYQVQIKI